MAFAPIIVFVYRRLDHTQQTISALQQNRHAADTDLYIFSDAPKTEDLRESVQAIRTFAKSITGFRTVTLVEREVHCGLAKSVIAGVTEVCRQHERVIVLEDDLVTSQHFLAYMNSALTFYQDYHRVFSISGYNLPLTRMAVPAGYPYDTFFNYRPMSWGWATWWDRWRTADWSVPGYEAFRQDPVEQQRFNRGGDDLTLMLQHQMEARIDSWYIRWCYTHYRQGAVSLYPLNSYINNIGLDGSGTHSPIPLIRFANDLSRSKPEVIFPLPVEVDPDVMACFVRAWAPDSAPPLPPWRRVAQRLKRLLMPVMGKR